MRRLARRLFTLCSAVSLLLGVAACVMWVRSYRVADQWALAPRPAEAVQGWGQPAWACRWLTSDRGRLKYHSEHRYNLRADGTAALSSFPVQSYLQVFAVHGEGWRVPGVVDYTQCRRR